MMWVSFVTIAAVVVSNLLPAILILILLAVVVTAVGIGVETLKEAIAYRRSETEMVIHRANRQHRQIVSGDLIGGTYGEYLPPAGLR